jgi:hypothetical protein
MKASVFRKLTFIEQVKAYVTECEVTVAIEKMDPGILSDIGTEGVVFDSYVVYLARGTYDFGVISGVLGYYVWTETSIPGTLEAPPEGNVVELLTTRSLEEAISLLILKKKMRKNTTARQRGSPGRMDEVDDFAGLSY